jgi:hypothetical protein
MMDVLIKIKDRDGVHELQAPTDMAMNIMELCKIRASSGRNVRRNGYVCFLPMLCA